MRSCSSAWPRSRTSSTASCACSTASERSTRWSTSRRSRTSPRSRPSRSSTSKGSWWRAARSRRASARKSSACPIPDILAAKAIPEMLVVPASDSLRPPPVGPVHADIVPPMADPVRVPLLVRPPSPPPSNSAMPVVVSPALSFVDGPLRPHRLIVPPPANREPTVVLAEDVRAAMQAFPASPAIITEVPDTQPDAEPAPTLAEVEATDPRHAPTLPPAAVNPKARVAAGRIVPQYEEEVDTGLEEELDVVPRPVPRVVARVVIAVTLVAVVVGAAVAVQHFRMKKHGSGDTVTHGVMQPVPTHVAVDPAVSSPTPEALALNDAASPLPAASLPPPRRPPSARERPDAQRQAPPPVATDRAQEPSSPRHRPTSIAAPTAAPSTWHGGPPRSTRRTRRRGSPSAVPTRPRAAWGRPASRTRGAWTRRTGPRRRSAGRSWRSDVGRGLSTRLSLSKVLPP